MVVLRSCTTYLTNYYYISVTNTLAFQINKNTSKFYHRRVKRVELTCKKTGTLNSGTSFPREKALGINWDIGTDTLGFKLNLDGKPTTRRQMLSMISKIYDPLGLAAPFLLKGKRILQELCKSNFSWDDAVSDDYIVEWERWKKELQLVENLKMERCSKPSKFDKVIDCSLHHFSDASQDGLSDLFEDS